MVEKDREIGKWGVGLAVSKGWMDVLRLFWERGVFDELKEVERLGRDVSTAPERVRGRWGRLWRR